MRDPYSLIRELIFKYKGRPQEEVEKTVLDAFQEAYGIYLPDLGVPYEELAHYIREGREDEAYDWLEKYLYMHLLREYEREIREQGEYAKSIGEAILKFLKEKKIKPIVATEEDVRKWIEKLISSYTKLQEKYKELKRKLASLKKESAEKEMAFKKGEIGLETFLRTAKEVEEKTKPLKEEIERLRKENEELRELISKLRKEIYTKETEELEKAIKEASEELKKISEEYKEHESELKGFSKYEEVRRRLAILPADRLVEVYYNPERFYPGLTPEEYEVIKRVALSLLREKRWRFCPIHRVPLVRLHRYMGRDLVAYGIEAYVCPEGKEIYVVERGRLVSDGSLLAKKIREVEKLVVPRAPPRPAPAPPERKFVKYKPRPGYEKEAETIIRASELLGHVASDTMLWDFDYARQNLLFWMKDLKSRSPERYESLKPLLQDLLSWLIRPEEFP